VTGLRGTEQSLPIARPVVDPSRNTGGGGRPGPCELFEPPPPPPPPLAEAGADKARTHMIRIPAAKPPAIRLCNLIMIRLLSSRRRQSTPSLLRWLRGPKSGSSAPFAPRRRGRASVTPYSLCTTSSPGSEAVHRLRVVITDPPAHLGRGQADSRAWRARKWWKSRGLLPVVRACARQGVLPRNRGKAQYLRDRKPTPSLCFCDPGATRLRPGPGGHSAMEATAPLSGQHPHDARDSGSGLGAAPRSEFALQRQPKKISSAGRAQPTPTIAQCSGGGGLPPSLQMQAEVLELDV
jgi:hypothetical protein